MDNVEILESFEKEADGTWVARADVTIMGERGPVEIAAGERIGFGERRGELDVAEYLEQLGVQFGS